MHNFDYLKLDVIFFSPLIVLLLLYFHKVVLKNVKYILFCSFLGAVYFFIVDPLATVWKAWQFNYDHTIGVRFGPSVLEELIWAILVFFILGIMVSILGDAEEKKKSFKQIIQKR